MSVTLSTPINNVYTRVAQPYTPGDGVLVVTDGTAFSNASPSESAPVRLTAITADTYGTVNETLTVFSCTGVPSSNTLTVAAITSGQDASTDRPFAIQDIVEVRITAGTIADLNASVVASGLPTTGLTITQWVGAITTINCTNALTAAINCANTNAFVVNLYASASPHTFTLSNLAVGQTVKVTIVQGATVSTVAWAGQAIAWAGGTEPTLAKVAGHMDTLTLYCPVTGTIGGALGLSDYIAPA